MFHNIVIFLVVLSLVIGDDLPKYFKKCSKSDPNLGKCVADSANTALQYFAKGDVEYDIPSFNPLKVPLITINSNIFEVNLTDSIVEGICHSKIVNSILDFHNKNFEFLVETPKIIYFTNYNISYGPISAYGNANFTFDGLQMKFGFTYKLVNVEDNEYIKLEDASLTYTFENLSVNIENLSELSNATKSDIEEAFAANKLGINDQLNSKIGKAMAQSVAKILSDLFDRVPLNILFDE